MAWGTLEPGAPPAGRPPPEGECHLWVARDGEGTRASRALQRLVAAHYLATDPQRVVIRRTCQHCGSPTHGRPELVDGGALDFSVTHSGEWFAMAVVGSGRVGLDLERLRPLDDLDELADAVLAPAEAAEFRSLPAGDREGWLYRAWVRKEAVVKLTGHGLDLEPVYVDARGADAVVTSAPRSLPREGIRLRDLPAPPGYCAALASTRPVRTVRSFRVAG